MGKSRDSANLVSQNNIFTDIANDRTGIGTTNPQYKLDILGDINFTGTFRQNGSAFVASRWTAGTGDDIYRLDGDVGIGTTNPTTKLSISGDWVTSLGQISINASSGQRYSGLALRNNGTTKGYLYHDNTDELLDVYAPSGVGLRFSTNSNETLRITSGGSIGIGTTNPSEKLTVVGVVSATSYRGDGSQLTGVGGQLDITSSLFI
jgi:hypothetical protein